jgi:hypothetical protein
METQSNPVPDIREKLPDGLVDAERCLEIVFPVEQCRPSMRTLARLTAAKKIPSIKLGRKRLYHPRNVLDSIMAMSSGGVR